MRTNESTKAAKPEPGFCSDVSGLFVVEAFAGRGLPNPKPARKLAGMFQEYARVKQEAGEGRRRWFDDGDMELIVWLDAADRSNGFQLCHQGAAQQEHAVTWRASGGFAHNRVAAGDTRPDKNMAPILAPDGSLPWERRRGEFAICNVGRETPRRDFITARLAEGEK